MKTESLNNLLQSLFQKQRNNYDMESFLHLPHFAIKQAFFHQTITFLEKLSKVLGREGIHIILGKSREEQIYGVTYVDLKSKPVVWEKHSVLKEFEKAIP